MSGSQAIIDFLSRLRADEVEWGALAATDGCEEIVRIARGRGVEADEAALRAAFAHIMKARLVASRLGKARQDQAGGGGG